MSKFVLFEMKIIWYNVGKFAKSIEYIRNFSDFFSIDYI